MYLKSVLTISLIVNAFLVYFVLSNEVAVAENDLEGVSTAIDPATSKNDFSDQVASSAKDYYHSLQKIGLSGNQQKTLLKSYLKSLYIKRESKVADDFWRFDNALNQQNKDEAFENIRTSLVTIYGDGVFEDPLFEEFFKPMNTQLPFLDGRKQIAVNSLLIELKANLKPGGVIGPKQMQQLRAKELQIHKKIRSLLTEDEFNEYELRMSKLSAMLRSYDLDLSEDEFRRTFAFIKANETLRGLVLRESMGFLGESMNEYDQLKSILGEEKYEEFITKVNPMSFSMQNFKASYAMPR